MIGVSEKPTVRRRIRLTDKTILYMFLGVPVALLVFVFLFPLLYSLWMSFTDRDMSVRSPSFVGLQNYINVLSDSQVWNSIRVTLTFAGSSLILQIVVGFALALLIDYIGFFKGVFRTLAILPILLTPVVLGVIWRVMLNYDYGIVNYFVKLLGLPPKNWLQDPSLAMPILVLLDSWHTIPFVMLVLAAGLSSLPREPFESAQIDGASAWQTLWLLTIPMLRPVFMVVVVFRSYALLGAFDFVFTLTEGGPARMTQVLSHLIYIRLFNAAQVGYSSAIAVVLLVITLVIVLFFIRRMELPDDPTPRVRPISDSDQPGILSLAGRLIAAPLKLTWHLIDVAISAIGSTIAGLTSRLVPRRVADQAARQDLITRKMKRRIGVTVAFSVLLLWLAFSLFPIFWVYFSSLKEPMDVFALPPKWLSMPTLHNYEVVLGLKYGTEAELSMLGVKPPLSRLPQFFTNSITISVATTILSLIFGTAAAYALVRLRPRGHRAILIGMLITRMIPGMVVALPIYMLWRSIGIIDTLGGLVFAYLSFSLPFTIWMMRGYLLDMPVELEEAAMVDGCSRIGALVRIVLPLVTPGLSATAVFVFLGAWNQFLFPLLLGGNTAKPVSVEILTYITYQSVLFGRLYAASGLILLPVLLFTLYAQRYVATGLTGGALKG